NEPALQVTGQTVRSVGRLLKQRYAGAGLVFHSPIIVDIAEQQIATFLPPQRPLGGSLAPAIAIGEIFDALRGRDNALHFGRELLDTRRHGVVGHGRSSGRAAAAGALADYSSAGAAPTAALAHGLTGSACLARNWTCRRMPIRELCRRSYPTRITKRRPFLSRPICCARHADKNGCRKSR